MKYFKHIITKDILTGADLPEKTILYFRPESSVTGLVSIPNAPGNSDYDQMISEVSAGESEIVEVDSTNDWRP